MRKGCFLLVAVLLVMRLSAQIEHSYVQEGEFGISAGAAHYFGDLNPRARLNRPKMAMGVFFRKQFSNYIALRVSGHFAQLGYSDIYNKDNAYELRRNLSFNTNIWELGLQGDFNFFKFVPGSIDYPFTPYVTFGLGVFSFDPYAYYQGQKVYLRPLGTEGQGSAKYPDRKPYGTMAMYIPFGVGVKYNVTPKVNLGFEVVYRFTSTDYLDDVSSTYPDPSIFPKMPDGSPSLAEIMSDRSNETGASKIGFVNGTGRQRGFAGQKDAYVMGEIMLSFNLSSYRCPKP